jgi:hypothetical protein
VRGLPEATGEVGVLSYNGGNIGKANNTASCCEPLFPLDFISETIRTLALLFPQNDRATARWLSSQQQQLLRQDQHGYTPTTLSSSSLLEVFRCGSLRALERRLDGFSFWRDRLVILRQAFDESHPHTLRQWWVDRRNGVQWYTFWVAILIFIVTIAFGAVQIAEGALQVYIGFRQLQLQSYQS